MGFLDKKNPPKDDTMEMSFTKLGYFASCPRKYYFRYILKIPQPANVNLIGGKAIHKASANGFTEKMKTTLPPSSIVVEDAVHEYETGLLAAKSSGAGIETATKDDEVKEKDNVARSQKVYYEKIMTTHKPTAVEKKYETNFKNHALSIIGYIDRIDDQVIVELKTTAKTPNLLMYSPQVILYGHSQKINNVKIECVIKKKEPEVLEVPFRITEEQKNNMLYNILSVSQAIQNLDGKGIGFWWQNAGFACGMCWYKDACFGRISKQIEPLVEKQMAEKQTAENQTTTKEKKSKKKEVSKNETQQSGSPDRARTSRQRSTDSH